MELWTRLTIGSNPPQVNQSLVIRCHTRRKHMALLKIATVVNKKQNNELHKTEDAWKQTQKREVKVMLFLYEEL